MEIQIIFSEMKLEASVLNLSLELLNLEFHKDSVNFSLFIWTPAIPRSIQASINVSPPTGVK